MRRWLKFILLVLSWPIVAADFPAPYNTEDPSYAPLPAQDAVRKFRLPAGFSATVFAAEPAVQQPIAMTFDSRGRLWVAENYTYAEQKRNYDHALRDRILIFEDTDHDGRFDRRKVFWDQAQLLTSIELGFGGVWALCAPNLVFIPDRDGDDTPDGEPEVLLDGWDTGPVRHNIVNGLKWGPDGWLYGRHGIQATSRVGAPGGLPEQRQLVNCAIWRFHPVRKTFEVVARGTTNPWGMDWNAEGEAFFINTVIGHLWHLIPGAHYRRMYGEDFDPDLYELIDQHADHYHWNTGEAWSDVRKVLTGLSAQAGGGHAHVGLMIYQGLNWPEQYRGRVLTLNLHGHRLNQDRLEQVGSGYVGRHEPDPCFFDDPSFRGIDLSYGPDGGVYILDWSDTGECHEQDGVHRTSGRIYKVTYGRPEDPGPINLARLSDADLAQMQMGDNEWFARQSRRLLQERAAAGILTPVHDTLLGLFAAAPTTPKKLRALWALRAVGQADAAWLRHCLRDSAPAVRVWAIRLLSEGWSSSSPVDEPEALNEFVRLASEDASAAVRLALASVLQRLPLPERARLGAPLLAHAEDAGDHNLPLMLWYGVKGIVESDPEATLALARSGRIPLVRRFIARRLAEGIDQQVAGVNALLQLAMDQRSLLPEIVTGMAEGLRGRRQAPRPADWERFEKAMGSEAEMREGVRALALVFGSGRALEELQTTVLDESADIPTRRAALQALMDHRAPSLRAVCVRLLDQRELAGLAAGGLALIDDPAIADLLLAKYGQLHRLHRPAVLAALVSRPSFARELLNRLGEDPPAVPRTDLTALHARQIISFGDEALTRKLGQVWGQVRETDAARRETIARYRQRLTPEKLKKADRDKGHQLFQQVCATCHRLYGEGGAIGPDLTGAGRDNMEYLLENVIDPSALVPESFHMSVVTLKDGRVLNGVVLRRARQTIDLQTVTERVVLETGEIVSVEGSNLSLMPEGLLEPFSETQVRDLIAFLMSKPLAGAAIAP